MEFVIITQLRDASKMFTPMALVYVLFLFNYQVEGVQYLKREKRDDTDEAFGRPNRYSTSASVKMNHVARFRPAKSNSLATRAHQEEIVGQIAKRFLPKSIDEAEPLAPLPIRHAVSYVKERAIRSSPEDQLSKKRTVSARGHFRSKLINVHTEKGDAITEDRFKSDIRHEIEKKQQKFHPNQTNKTGGHSAAESKGKIPEFEIRDFSGQNENGSSGDSEAVEDVTDSSYDNALQMQNFSQGQSLSDELDYSYDNLFSGSASGSGCATGSGSGCSFEGVADEVSSVAHLPKGNHTLGERLAARSLVHDFSDKKDSRLLSTITNRQLINHLVQLKSLSSPTKEHKQNHFDTQTRFAPKKSKIAEKNKDPHHFEHENQYKVARKVSKTRAANSTSISEKHIAKAEVPDTSTFLGSSGFANDPMMTYEALLRTDKFPEDIDTTKSSASSSKERRELYARKSSLATLVRQLAMIDPNENEESNSGESDQSATNELRENVDSHLAAAVNRSDTEKSLSMRKRSLDDDNYEDRDYSGTKNRRGLGASSQKEIKRHERSHVTKPSFGGDSASTLKVLQVRHRESDGESDKHMTAERRSILSDADPNVNYVMKTEGKSEEKDESEAEPTQRPRSKLQKSRILDALKDAMVLYAGYKKSSVPKIEHATSETKHRSKQVEGIWTGLGSKPQFINNVDSEDEWHSGENNLSTRSTEEIEDSAAAPFSKDGTSQSKENESELHVRSVGRHFVTEHKRSSMYKEMKNNFLRRTQRSLHQQRRMVKEPEEKYLDTRGKGKVIIAFEDVKELVPRHLHPYEEEDVPSFYLDTKERLAKSVEEDMAAMPYRENPETGHKMIQARSSFSDDDIDVQNKALDQHRRQRRVQDDIDVKAGVQDDDDVKYEVQDNNDVKDGVQDINDVKDGDQDNNDVKDGVQDNNDVKDGAQDNIDVKDGAQGNSDVEDGVHDDNDVKDRIQDDDHVRDPEGGHQGHLSHQSHQSHQSHSKKRSSHAPRKTEKRSHDEMPVVRTLSVDYVMNKDEKGKGAWEQGFLKTPEEKSFLHVKRAQSEDGYLGCFIDVIHPDRDLPVRAGIPFVTPNNCRSACKRTGYYYAGLQYGYLCFCGNTYGRYDMAPESECSHTCSGDSNKRCGGYWRNAIFDTAGAPDIANEGPIPFYLPPKKAEDPPSSNATEAVQNKTSAALLLPPSTSQPPILPPPPLPQQKPSAINTITPPSFFLSPKNSQNPSILSQSSNISMQQPLPARGNTVKFIKIADITRNGTTILQPGIRLLAKSLIPQLSNIQIIATNPISSQAINAREVINTDIVKKSSIPEPRQARTGAGGQVMFNDPTILRREPKLFLEESNPQGSLMHWAYIHPQSRSDIVPTLMPHPTQPIKVQPDTRVYKGEIRLRQNWYDDFKDPSSAKYQILAGNVEQALKSIYSNDSDFVNARVLAFREGVSNTNPNTVEKVICEFSMTFGQEAVSPDAKLLEFVRSHQNRLEEMPIYSTTLKLSEYHFDPKDPHQQFLSPSNMSLIDVRSNVPKSIIPQRTQGTLPSNTTTFQPVNESRAESPYVLHGTYAFNAVPIPSQQQQLQNTQKQSQGMMELQSYLKAQNNQTPREKGTVKALRTPGMVGDSASLWNAKSQQSQAAVNNTANVNPSPQNQARKKVPYILRLFFWKDMLARKKRASQPLPSHRRLRRKKRQEPTEFQSEDDNNKRVKRRPLIDIHRKSRSQSEVVTLPNTLAEGTRVERRHKKTRRKTKDLSVEKELRRSKRS